ncbi:PKHD-type hydroxylase [Sphaerotilus sulfidivorans]|jgi:PKHD-type hydroxylase|uniref:Fe2+-dependent dioxygenase n=1 Tax=Sphaerotilus sulfidivorans TaxID=639200 RepID=A0A5C1PY48_9BURK|nr:MULTISPECIES: Fe2+-dependent dioxygenase [Sphaerotilus]MCK6403001.1 Fe2+-dependent dioxygenase [Sphaerotilus sulfidivorans]NZD44297.1 Fe2+-dependent dioxygenase [Sphaerotilus sulfidivorans]QEN00178.1 Fe2+-dependent dioxygenase [Sphaerotilus sulfidivorans]GKQ59070.1 PKHD-type hydroxylase [Sphaerotilus sp. FB-3]
MLIRIPAVLDAAALAQARRLLADAPWSDGAVTAGAQALTVKNNEQLPVGSAVAQALQGLILSALDRHPLFFSATLPKRVFPPMFNRYGGRTNTYGAHVDNAVRYVPARGGLPPERVRTDISCTLFLADPADYDGGELVIDDTYGEQRVKLAAGDMVVYPGTSVHRVEPVTRGHRVASFFWVESMVRSDEQRRLLHDMDRHLMHLRSTVGETDAGVVGLTGSYHNLLRLWADT